jgi:hypothetical protein
MADAPRERDVETGRTYASHLVPSRLDQTASPYDSARSEMVPLADSIVKSASASRWRAEKIRRRRVMVCGGPPLREPSAHSDDGGGAVRARALSRASARRRVTHPAL